ncbi:YcaO-like family protein [Streptomyces sp. NPDC005728]|uniref:YcaO-like family protein n=1 Tax=Streptomyces sp. NPDC005728 TaxID=3157054 RepID=UPI0033D4D8EA
MERAASRLGLRPQWRPLAGVGGAASVWACTLLNGAGAPVPDGVGVGKGNNAAAARERALGEALERLVTGPMSLAPGAVLLCRADRLAAGALATDASAPLLTALGGTKLACHVYQGLNEPQREARIPLYLGAPWYAGPEGQKLRDAVGDRADYQALSRYSVNSGYGLAPSDRDATVHALLETIERDSCSLTTIHTLLAGRPPTVFDVRSLPGDLTALHHTAEQEAEGVVHLVDATSDLGVPTVLAYRPPQPTGGGYLRGQAAGLSMRQAVTGALLELLESALVRRRTPPEPVQLGLLEPYPALHRCAVFDLTGPLRRARRARFEDALPAQEPEEPLDALLACLAQHDLSAYRRTVAAMPEGVCAVHVVVPGLERFFAVVKGALVVPGPRGTTLT